MIYFIILGSVKSLVTVPSLPSSDKNINHSNQHTPPPPPSPPYRHNSPRPSFSSIESSHSDFTQSTNNNLVSPSLLTNKNSEPSTLNANHPMPSPTCTRHTAATQPPCTPPRHKKTTNQKCSCRPSSDESVGWCGIKQCCLAPGFSLPQAISWQSVSQLPCNSLAQAFYSEVKSWRRTNNILTRAVRLFLYFLVFLLLRSEGCLLKKNSFHSCR